MIRSTCSYVSLIGSRWIAFGRASVVPEPPTMSIVNTWLSPPCRIAAANSRAGSAMCCGFSPWPYSTAGTFPARRVRRAPPLPNSVRSSALIFTSDTGKTPETRSSGGCGASAVPGGGGALGTGPEHRVDHGAVGRLRHSCRPRGTLAVATVQAYLASPHAADRPRSSPHPFPADLGVVVALKPVYARFAPTTTPRSAVRGLRGQLKPPKSVVTEPSSKTS